MISCLYPIYVRGEAYLAAGQGNAAATEFQKILDHSGIVWNCWTGALAHLGVARANALEFENLARGGCRCGPRPSARCLQRFPRSLERRRPRHPHPQASQGRVREAAVSGTERPRWRFSYSSLGPRAEDTRYVLHLSINRIFRPSEAAKSLVKFHDACKLKNRA